MPRNYYNFIWLLILGVLVTGLFFPYLQGNDATEYASIATQMYLRNDWVNIINHHPDTGQVYDYLDKPHLLFWSAMIGYKLFGVHEWSYRLVSVLMTLAAAFATYRLGKLVYDTRTGKIAAVVFITSQAIILANHDVKTDTLLTSFVALAIWQLAEFVNRQRLMNMIWAGAFLAGGVGTKGLIAVLVSGSVIFFYILGRRQWKLFYSWKWLVGVASFFLFLSPILYCYYLQFDLHPEKFVNGGYGRSGIKFLLWSQSFERFAGDRKFVLYPEFSFFFHTFLWAFLPWSILTYTGVVSRIIELIKTKGKSFFTREQLSFTGVWAIFILMSLSKFKLPHYINVLFPVFAVFTAGFIVELWQEKKEKFLKGIIRLQWVIVFVALVLLFVLNVWAFPANWALILLAVVGTGYLFYLLRFPKGELVFRAWFPSAVAITLLNILMNVNFYPKSQRYQGGLVLAEKLQAATFNWSNLYYYQHIVHWFDYYSQHWPLVLNNEEIASKRAKGEEVILYLDGFRKPELDRQFKTQVLMAQPNFEVAGMTGKFINPKTRKEACDSVYIVKIL
jgi:4-amino-4-deoxy-L-arabinose transferase-like glycosyltransferase